MTNFPSPEDDNPYRSPVDDSPPPASIHTPGSLTNVFHRENVRQFRLYMHVLGGIFLAMACLVILLAAWVIPLEDAPDEQWFGVLLIGGLGAIWFGLGVAICCKQMWAVYIGTVLCYLSLFGNLLRCNFCGIVIIACILAVAHAAISRARVLQRAGIPLTTKPRQLD